ncbi:MAG TPA: hypothetical protein VMW23_03615 [Sedimentisphaerales bacterium]|nr:hypothetical protein [Sedimentisphaerales bacterium]
MRKQAVTGFHQVGVFKTDKKKAAAAALQRIINETFVICMFPDRRAPKVKTQS